MIKADAAINNVLREITDVERFGSTQPGGAQLVDIFGEDHICWRQLFAAKQGTKTFLDGGRSLNTELLADNAVYQLLVVVAVRLDSAQSGPDNNRRE